MKGLKTRLVTRVSRMYWLACLLPLAALQAQATSYLLANKNSSLGLDAGTSAGINSWVVDGIDQLNQQWFWFRVGSGGPQYDLTAITATPFVSVSGSGNQLTAWYTNGAASYGVRLDLTLAGQASGSGKSGLTETVRVFNYSSSAALDFHLFMYSDFTLRSPALANSQYVQLGNDGLGDSTSVQTLGNFGVGTNNFVGMTVADRVEAALYDQTLTALTTVNGYDLNNVAAAGPGHVTWALQWNMTVAPNSSIPLSLLDNLVQVPEPHAAALLVAGLGFILFRRQLRDL